MTDLPDLPDPRDLRVAFIAGTLGCGGAERQLLFQLHALRAQGVDVQLFSLTRGEFYEAAIHALGVPVHWTGPATHPLARLRTLRRTIGAFRPHVVQAAHFFVNLYAVAVGRRVRAVELGAVRNDGFLDVKDSGVWGYPQLRAPRALVVNSEAATHNVVTLGARRDAVYLLPNVIDLAPFDRAAAAGECMVTAPVAMVVGRLTAFKRQDRFLAALQIARDRLPELRGIIVGDGPTRSALEANARARGLLPDAITFTGACADIPARLRGATMLVSCSDHEGCPNVLLEAMAARLPVIATPAGESANLIRDSRNGFIVPFDDTAALADAMVRLAQSPTLARRLGDAGRDLIERRYTPEALAPRLLDIYSAAAAQQRRTEAVAAVNRHRRDHLDATSPMASAAAAVPNRDDKESVPIENRLFAITTSESTAPRESTTPPRNASPV